MNNCYICEMEMEIDKYSQVLLNDKEIPICKFARSLWRSGSGGFDCQDFLKEKFGKDALDFKEIGGGFFSSGEVKQVISGAAKDEILNNLESLRKDILNQFQEDQKAYKERNKKYSDIRENIKKRWNKLFVDILENSGGTLTRDDMIGVVAKNVQQLLIWIEGTSDSAKLAEPAMKLAEDFYEVDGYFNKGFRFFAKDDYSEIELLVDPLFCMVWDGFTSNEKLPESSYVRDANQGKSYFRDTPVTVRSIFISNLEDRALDLKSGFRKTGNGRYTLTDEKSSKVDVKSELKKMQDLLDEGLISQDDYDKKKKELLGL